MNTAASMGDQVTANDPLTYKLHTMSIPSIKTEKANVAVPPVRSGLFFDAFACNKTIITAKPERNNIGNPRGKNHSLPPVNLSRAYRNAAVPENHEIITRQILFQVKINGAAIYIHSRSRASAGYWDHWGKEPE